MSKQIAVSHGEIVDKVTILEIKKERISAADKLANVRAEWDSMQAPLQEIQQALKHDQQVSFLELFAALKDINTQLWEVEDALRLHERDQSFGADFVELARSVYHLNDRRALLKKQINTLTGSQLVEEKSYEPYQSPRQ